MGHGYCQRIKMRKSEFDKGNQLRPFICGGTPSVLTSD
jgi:hypothetical protein